MPLFFWNLTLLEKRELKCQKNYAKGNKKYNLNEKIFQISEEGIFEKKLLINIFPDAVEVKKCVRKRKHGENVMHIKSKSTRSG